MVVEKDAMKALRYSLSALFIATGALLVLYGIFALAYSGEASGGTTTIEIAGRETDAHVAGALSLALGVGLFASAYLIAAAGPNKVLTGSDPVNLYRV